MKLRRIDRFKRRPSEAHLLTPPDTTPFTYILDCSERQIAGWQPLIDELAANGIKPPKPEPVQVVVNDFMAGPLNPIPYAPYPLSKLVADATQLGCFDHIDMWEEEGGYYRYIRITRRPKISPKLLANLTPLQRQRMHSARPPVNNVNPVTSP